jgi:hypothetical protein
MLLTGVAFSCKVVLRLAEDKLALWWWLYKEGTRKIAKGV